MSARYLVQQLSGRRWVSSPVSHTDEVAAWAAVLRLGQRMPGRAWRVVEVGRG